MKKFVDKLYTTLEESVANCKSESLALSGGLDSTILGYFMRNKKPTSIAIISKDFLATDLTYCQLVAQEFDMPLQIKSVTTEELFSGIEECIKILKNFNDIEIRNSVVMYLALLAVKELNQNYIITGDGADELFAGYNFFLEKTTSELEKELERIWSIMHFPSIELGRVLGITVETPFLEENIVKLAKTIPASFKVGEKNSKKYGKWILRKTFEEKIPKSIVWREKSPLQDGAGTSGLTNLFENLFVDNVFNEKKKKILESDGVKIRTKESLHYYEIFRKFFDIPSRLHSSDNKCPYCGFEVKQDSKFCRMCGAFPI